MKIGKFRMRVKVTSIISSNEEMLVFNGMSVDKEKLFSNVSARSYITVKIAASCCNSMPRKGQVWTVLGAPEVLEVQIGRFIVSNIIFDQPLQAEMVIPETIEEFKEFIAKDREFEGIGSAEAAKLFNEFGLDLFDMLNSNDLSKIEAHPKLCKHIPSLVRGWNKYENLKYASYFVDLGIPPTVQQLLFKFHDNKAINTIKENPYVLLTFGMKFKAVDAIARDKFNIPADDLNRTLAIVENAMRSFVNQGHTCVKLDKIHSKLSTELHGDNEAFRVLLDSKKNLGVHYNYITDTVHSTPYLIMEDVIARRIIKLASTHVELDTTYDKALSYALSKIPFELNEKQLNGVQKALSNEYSCIIGGAGTGKTTVLEAVTKAYAYLDFDIYPLALSGRAAMRLQESVEYPTQTIANFIFKQV
jgi:exodeoxyribonuclease V alpha subunit